jgi:integrase
MANVTKFKPRPGDPKKRPRWQARWRDPDGRQRAQVFDRKVDAEQHLVAVEHRMLLGEYVDPSAGKVTVREWCELWRLQQPHRPRTVEQVESNFRTHVYPVLGNRELRSLRPSDLQGWVTAMAQHSSPTTVTLVYRQLGAALKAAEHDRIIGRSPAARVKLPKRVQIEIVPPTVAEVEAVADAMFPRYRGVVALAAGTGLRLGEVLGLGPTDVDFLRRTVRVDKQLCRSGELGPPKTAASVRTVPVADVVLEELARHIEQFPGEDGFIFTSGTGAPVTGGAFGSLWRKARTKAGVPEFRFHDLRHFYASALISAGCSVKAVQKALGHASATETLNTYAHLWPDDEDRTRAAIQAALTGAAHALPARDAAAAEHLGRLLDG